MLRKDYRAPSRGTQNLAHFGLMLLTCACLFGALSSPDLGFVIVVAMAPMGLFLFFAAIVLQSAGHRRALADLVEPAD